jgi:hypothetical protein
VRKVLFIGVIFALALALTGSAYAEQVLTTTNGKGSIGQSGRAWRAAYVQTIDGDATGSISGYLMLASPKTASYSITAADCGKLITASTSGAKEFDLPAVTTISAGWSIAIANSGGATLTVNPYGTDSTILGLTSSAGDAISNSTVGNTVTLTYTAQGWVATAIYGTWADAN